MLRVTKNKLLIKQLDTQTELGNGLSITNETQSRKDIIKGLVIEAGPEIKAYINNVVYFPLYAALPLSNKGENYLIVDFDDVLAYDTKDSE